MNEQVRIGTRGSPLALAQAAIVRGGLIATGLVAAEAIRIEIIKTSGDRIQDRSLADIGGKGLFTKEIEEALLGNRIDLAVHSLKDLPAWMPEGLILAAILPRADPRDALLSPLAERIADLPKGARIGTSSPRRRAILLSARPDLDVVELRGNVGTRLAKLEAGEVDATLLAVAGLSRLGLSVPYSPLDPSEMLPAASQGAIGLEIRGSDERALQLCAALNDPDSTTVVTAERALLDALDGSCRTPIGALATLSGGDVLLDALVGRQDGTDLVRLQGRAPRAESAQLGKEIGRQLRARMPADFFAERNLPGA